MHISEIYTKFADKNSPHMKNKIDYLNWRNYFNADGIYAIGEELILLDKQLMQSPKEPFKLDMLTAVVCLKGHARGSVNLEPIETRPNTFNVFLPGQIVTHDYQSDDFEAKYIIMSLNFIEQLGLNERFTIYNSQTHLLQATLSEYELNGILSFYRLLKWNISNHTNNYLLETAKYMTLAFFYGFSHTFNHAQLVNNHASRPQQIANGFMSMVKKHFRHQHSLDFYANELCVTPKYLTTTVKSETGVNAKEWISRYLILEAQALLKSTDLTIQQISEELGFSSQDVFGKYFKHHTGISAKEYRTN